MIACLIAAVLFASGLYIGAIKAYDFGAAFTTKPYVHDRLLECSDSAVLYKLAAAVDSNPSREHELLLKFLSNDLLKCSMLITIWPHKINPQDKVMTDKVMAVFMQACTTRIAHKFCNKPYP